MDTTVRDFVLIPHILMKLPAGLLQGIGYEFSGFSLIDLASVHSQYEHAKLSDASVLFAIQQI